MSLVVVGTYKSSTEASLVKAKLVAYGIEAITEAPVFSSSFPNLETVEGVRVLVREEDLAESLEVLERMLPAGD